MEQPVPSPPNFGKPSKRSTNKPSLLDDDDDEDDNVGGAPPPSGFPPRPQQTPLPPNFGKPSKSRSSHKASLLDDDDDDDDNHNGGGAGFPTAPSGYGYGGGAGGGGGELPSFMVGRPRIRVLGENGKMEDVLSDASERSAARSVARAAALSSSLSSSSTRRKESGSGVDSNPNSAHHTATTMLGNDWESADLLHSPKPDNKNHNHHIKTESSKSSSKEKKAKKKKKESKKESVVLGGNKPHRKSKKKTSRDALISGGETSEEEGASPTRRRAPARSKSANSSLAKTPALPSLSDVSPVRRMSGRHLLREQDETVDERVARALRGGSPPKGRKQPSSTQQPLTRQITAAATKSPKSKSSRRTQRPLDSDDENDDNDETNNHHPSALIGDNDLECSMEFDTTALDPRGRAAYFDDGASRSKSSSKSGDRIASSTTESRRDSMAAAALLLQPKEPTINLEPSESMRHPSLAASSNPNVARDTLAAIAVAAHEERIALQQEHMAKQTSHHSFSAMGDDNGLGRRLPLPREVWGLTVALEEESHISNTSEPVAPYFVHQRISGRYAEPLRQQIKEQQSQSSRHRRHPQRPSEVDSSASETTPNFQPYPDVQIGGPVTTTDNEDGVSLYTCHSCQKRMTCLDGTVVLRCPNCFTVLFPD